MNDTGIGTKLTSSNLSPAFFNVISSYFSGYKTGKSSVNARGYHAELSAAIDAFFQDRPHCDPETGLTDLLLRMNFNTSPFIAFYQSKLQAAVDAIPDASLRLAAIADKATKLRKSPLSSRACCPGRPSVRESALETLHELFVNTLVCGLFQPVRDEPGTKLALNFSVAQLALFVKLQADEGLFRACSVTQLLKFTVRNYRSKRQDDFSYRTLSKEYYGANQVTAAVVRDLLVRMVARIDRNFFP
ncbi:hypothetical protein [Hufsiella ginkgonis]|uniref:Uncharacterized protein n=1 Tax=Hufsiella ginkgonis TaxID=2695274 RepID=A0A7K1XYK4_9SPHI|nr:hypothetical protein [Hufsiella ginkgonis]MXV16075.1 hypothetical protein [Hufsiella ginkgonis]